MVRLNVLLGILPADQTSFQGLRMIIRQDLGSTLEISGGKMGVQNPAKAWKDKETRA